MYNDIAFPKGLPSNQELDRDEILCFFQKCLRQCKNWNTILIGNQTIIDNETNRILMETNKQGYSYLEDLIKATLKSHLLILMYNPSCKEQIHIESSYYENKFSYFFYILYIEFAKVLWCNPYLMYHNYSPIDIKKNQRECIALIKECINESIKKILPIKQILYNYLREDINVNFHESLVNKPEYNKPDLKESIIIKPAHNKLEDEKKVVDNIKNILDNPITTNENIMSNLSDSTSSINESELKDSDLKDSDLKDSDLKNSDLKDSELKDEHISLVNTKIPEPCNNSHEQNVKEILNDLNNKESNESETSIMSKYKYKEIFGN